LTKYKGIKKRKLSSIFSLPTSFNDLCSREKVSKVSSLQGLIAKTIPDNDDNDGIVTDWEWTGLGDIVEYEKQFKYSPTQQQFVGVPFSTVPPAQRGILFEHLGRIVFEKRFGTTGDPLKHYDNGKTGIHDWSHNGMGIECKSSQMCYIKKGDFDFCWGFKWQAVKPDLFDTLVLVGYYPDRLNFWLWDHKTGIGQTPCEKANKNGFMITLQGKTNEDWRLFAKAPGKLFHTIMLPVQ
jgi:hypothetical protein